MQRFSEFDDGDDDASFKRALLQDALVRYIRRLVSVLKGETKVWKHAGKNFRANQSHVMFCLDNKEGKPMGGRLHLTKGESFLKWPYLPEGWDPTNDFDLKDLFQTNKHGPENLRGDLIRLTKSDSRSFGTWPRCNQIIRCGPAQLLSCLARLTGLY